jgi:hypothetical protein
MPTLVWLYLTALLYYRTSSRHERLLKKVSAWVHGSMSSLVHGFIRLVAPSLETA